MSHLNRYVIERDLPGAGKLTPAQLKDVATKSCDVLRVMGPTIQWVESYVTGDKVYCVYIADDERAIHEHAELSGFPANRVSRVAAVLDPASAGT